MSITLPKSGSIYLPQVPNMRDKQIQDYLQKLRNSIQNHFTGYFANDSALASVINSGTSGTFTISSGGSIVVSNGAVVSVSS